MAKTLCKHCKAINLSEAPTCHNCGKRIASGPSNERAYSSFSLTPQTDAAWFAAHQATRFYYDDDQLVDAEFARKLERDLNALKGLMAELVALQDDCVCVYRTSPIMLRIRQFLANA